MFIAKTDIQNVMKADLKMQAFGRTSVYCWVHYQMLQNRICFTKHLVNDKKSGVQADTQEACLFLLGLAVW